MSDFADMLEELVALRRDLSEMRAQVRNMLRTGTVAERDAEKGYRVDWGKDDKGEKILSPWYPHPESGGAAKTWLPLSVGQIVTGVNPGGDVRQGFLVRGGFSDANPKPSSNLAENVFQHGDLRVEATNGKCKISVGSAVIELAPGEITLTAAKITVAKG